MKRLVRLLPDPVPKSVLLPRIKIHDYLQILTVNETWTCDGTDRMKIKEQYLLYRRCRKCITLDQIHSQNFLNRFWLICKIFETREVNECLSETPVLTFFYS